MTDYKAEYLALKKELQKKQLQLAAKELQLSEKNQVIEKLEGRLGELLDALKLSQKHRFGKKSEKGSPEEEASLPEKDRIFDEPEIEEKTEKTSLKPDTKKATGGRKPLPKELPRKEIIHDIPEDQKICSCGHPLHKIGQETSEQLEVIPAKVVVHRHTRLRYGCNACQDTVLIAKGTAQPIPKSMSSASLLAHIMVAKYDDHLPLYRQSEIWQRAGVDLDRSTLGRWVIKCGKLLEPLVEKMHERMLADGYLQADETSVQVIGEKNRKNTSKSYMWAYKTGGNKKFKVVYEYAPERSAAVASSFLGNFKGVLQSDGYSGYKRVCKDADGKIQSAGCWAHARRKFFEVASMSKKPTVSQAMIEKIKALYSIEKEALTKDLQPDQVRQLRQEKAVPLLADIKNFLEKYRSKVPPKSGLGKAINYSLRQWDELTFYVQDGRVAIDNNAVERCIRPFAVGRKNWLFKGSVAGAKAGAVIYSLLETAKSHDLNPYDYFADILKKIPAGLPLENLLPYSWKTPE
ncbi:MAG: IS66 family transposase [Flavobacteriales bacterium]|nr:IS66 family transposase [Flavobacteriales bacterium]